MSKHIVWAKLDGIAARTRARTEARNLDPKTVPEIRYDLDWGYEGDPEIAIALDTLAAIWFTRADIGEDINESTTRTVSAYERNPGSEGGWIRRQS